MAPTAVKRGQVSLEFLTTYGWAIVLLVAIAAVLFWLGVINPRTVVTSTCALPADLGCKGYAMNLSGTLLFDMGQSTGKSIRVDALRCTQETNPNFTGADNLTAPVTIANGGHARLTNWTKSCYRLNSTGNPEIAAGSVGGLYKGRVYIQYVELDNGLPHLVAGDVVLRYEDIPSP